MSVRHLLHCFLFRWPLEVPLSRPSPSGTTTIRRGGRLYIFHPCGGFTTWACRFGTVTESGLLAEMIIWEVALLVLWEGEGASSAAAHSIKEGCTILTPTPKPRIVALQLQILHSQFQLRHPHQWHQHIPSVCVCLSFCGDKVVMSWVLAGVFIYIFNCNLINLISWGLWKLFYVLVMAATIVIVENRECENVL